MKARLHLPPALLMEYAINPPSRERSEMGGSSRRRGEGMNARLHLPPALHL